jgi:ATP-dependent Clp protease ATP-binding subunit ClpC
MGMFEKFSDRAKKVIQVGREEAKRLNHSSFGTEHLLYGILKTDDCTALKILREKDVKLDNLMYGLKRIIASRQPSDKSHTTIPFTAQMRKVLKAAFDEVSALKNKLVGTEHLLLALILEGSDETSRLLTAQDLDADDIRERIRRIRQKDSSRETTQTKTPALDAFGRDITKLARQGKLDPVIGRDNEIERVVQILSRRTKNNPVLIGEPGVGKTAIVEGLAHRIVNSEIPEVLEDKRIVSLDLAALVAGTKYRGQFEERLQSVIKELRESKDVIIFIDELHTLVGAGAAEGSIDASNMLKPSLSRGEIQCIGATTLDEYRKHIEKDGALERRFQTIKVDEPTVDETIQIIKGLKDRYETHHKAKYTDEAIEAAAKLASQYIIDRNLPDKAIDVLDEAGSRARIQAMLLPPHLREMEEEIKHITQQKEEAIALEGFETAANLRDQEKQMLAKFKLLKEEWKRSQAEKEVVVTAKDIAYIVSKWTGIPVYKLEEAESEKLLRMEEELHKRIVGQDEAISAITKAIRRSRAGFKNPKRPIGSFIFLGPTGVGKTELAKALAEFMFGDEKSLIRIDMSEHMERHSVSRLVGAPPGYVGYGEGGHLTEKVRRNPYSVILLDEIEKASPDVFNILLQVLEDGHLTDSMGRKVDFKHTVLIMTSNVGARLITQKSSLGFTTNDEEITYKKMKEMVMGEVKKTFNPEFLNRLDEVIVFHSLSEQHLRGIVAKEVRELNKQLKENGLEIVLEPDAVDWILKKEDNTRYGARPIKRLIQRHVEDVIAERVIRGELLRGRRIQVSVDKGELAFSPELTTDDILTGPGGSEALLDSSGPVQEVSKP